MKYLFLLLFLAGNLIALSQSNFQINMASVSFGGILGSSQDLNPKDLAIMYPTSFLTDYKNKANDYQSWRGTSAGIENISIGFQTKSKNHTTFNPKHQWRFNLSTFNNEVYSMYFDDEKTIAFDTIRNNGTAFYLDSISVTQLMAASYCNTWIGDFSYSITTSQTEHFWLEAGLGIGVGLNCRWNTKLYLNPYTEFRLIDSSGILPDLYGGSPRYYPDSPKEQYKNKSGIVVNAFLPLTLHYRPFEKNFLNKFNFYCQVQIGEWRSRVKNYGWIRNSTESVHAGLEIKW